MHGLSMVDVKSCDNTEMTNQNTVTKKDNEMTKQDTLTTLTLTETDSLERHV